MAKNNKNEDVNFDRITVVKTVCYQLHSQKAFKPNTWDVLQRIT